MRPMFHTSAFVGLLLAVLAGGLVTAPRGTELPGSTVKLIAAQGHGSAVHIGNGYYITAMHVVGTETKVKIKTDDGLLSDATVLWGNKAHDIALVRGPDDVASADLDCRVADEGEVISARGNPIDLEFINAGGHVAGIERPIGPWASALPVDMTIVMGMSGGPVFDADGDVIGIMVGVLVAPMGFGGSLTGMGTIVPSSAVCSLLGRSA